MNRLILTAAAAVLMAGTLATDADAMRRDSNAAYEQRIKLKAEWQQAQRAGGYSNPFTALVNLLTGQDTGNAVQPVINDPHSRGVTIYEGSTGKKK